MRYKSFFLILIFSFLSSPVSANLKEQFYKKENNKINKLEACLRLYQYAQFESKDRIYAYGFTPRFFIASDTKKIFLLEKNDQGNCGFDQVGVIGKNTKYNFDGHRKNYAYNNVKYGPKCFVTTYYEYKNKDLIEYKLFENCLGKVNNKIVENIYNPIR